MPKLLLGLLLYPLLLVCYPTAVLASTDPISATVSATARVPSTTPTTTDTTAPPAVILIAPHDGATTNQARPEFVWKQTFDTDSNYLTYTLYLNGVATYLGISNTGNSQQVNYLAHLGDGNVYLTPSLDLSPGHYDWFVRATDGSGNSSTSTTWRLTIDQTPPFLTVINLGDRYLNPEINEGSSFDLPGPGSVKLIFLTEPYATVSVTLTDPTGQTTTTSLPTNESGLAIMTPNLPLGLTQVVATSFDSAGLTSTLPLFTLNLLTTPYAGLIPPISLPSLSSLAVVGDFPLSLPATISQIQTDYLIPILYLSLLALAIAILLIYIWSRRTNILILDTKTNRPYRSLILYHSRPQFATKLRHTLRPLYLTASSPLLYSLDHTGRAYIARLGRFSSLTVRTPDGKTYILSLSRQQKSYTISL